MKHENLVGVRDEPINVVRSFYFLFTVCRVVGQRPESTFAGSLTDLRERALWQTLC